MTAAEKALKKGHAVSKLARGAMVKLVRQRETLVDTLGLMKEMGNDLMRTEKVTKELSLRKFVSLLILYAILVLQGVAILLVLYYKLYPWFSHGEKNTNSG